MASTQWGLTYEQFTETVLNYYGGQENYAKALQRGISSQDYANIFLKAGYTVQQNYKGDITYIGYNQATPAVAEGVPATINSNTQQGWSGGGASWSEPVGSTGDGTPTGNAKATTDSGGPTVRKYKNGTLDTSGGSKIIGGAGKVLASIMAYNQGLNLGKKVEKALYDADPDYWDSKGMRNLDPNTWDEIANQIDSPGAKFAFNLLADVQQPDKTSAPTTTLYTQDLAQAYFAKWLEQHGFLDKDEFKYKYENVSDLAHPSSYKQPIKCSDVMQFTIYDRRDITVTISNCERFIVYSPYYSSAASSTCYVFISTSPNLTVNFSDTWGNNNNESVQSINVNGQIFYYVLETGWFNSIPDALKGFINDTEGEVDISDWIKLTYFGTNVGTHTLAGVSDQNNASIFNKDAYGLTDDSTIQDYLNALKEFNPDAVNNRIEVDIVQSDGTTKTFTYWPTATGNATNAGNENQPITETQPGVVPQTQTQIDPQTATDTQIATLIKYLTQTLNQQGQPQDDPTGLVNPETQTQTEPDGKTTIKIELPDNLPPTGTGDTPIVTLPEGHASSLYAIYNPTLSQVNSLGAWLWSSDFIDQILKLFSDPMQAIIGLHKIYCTPSTGAEQNIKVGYLDSGVPSKIVTEQYTTVDCGSINLFEYFGNVFDYDPYTQLRLYLPFIGIVDIDTADAMRGVIHVVYHVDVLSGACLAEVRIQRDAAGGTLYQYAGNAAVTMPISSGSYIGVIANVVGVASSAIGGFASGGVAGGIAGGVTGALTRRGGTQIQHSGNFSGNAGAMGIKKPYLIIERPQTALAKNYQDYIGNPSNETVVLSSCTGYIKLKEVHLENVPATQTELDQIEQELKAGVII